MLKAVIKIERGRRVKEDDTQQHPFEHYFSIYELWFFKKKKTVTRFKNSFF